MIILSNRQQGILYTKTIKLGDTVLSESVDWPSSTTQIIMLLLRLCQPYPDHKRQTEKKCLTKQSTSWFGTRFMISGQATDRALPSQPWSPDGASISEKTNSPDGLQRFNQLLLLFRRKSCKNRTTHDHLNTQNQSLNSQTRRWFGQRAHQHRNISASITEREEHEP